MPFINGRYYMNPRYGEGVERARKNDLEKSLRKNFHTPHTSQGPDTMHGHGSHHGPKFSDELAHPSDTYIDEPLPHHFSYGNHGGSEVRLLANQQSSSTNGQHLKAQQKHPSQAKQQTSPPVTVYPNEEKVGGTPSWRNNNPANIMFSDNPHSVAQLYGAVGKDHGGRAIFPSMDAGEKAQDALLHSTKYRSLTIAETAGEWTGCKNPKNPGCEDPAVLRNYIHALSKAAGVPPNTPISHLTSAQLERLKQAQKRQEGFVPGVVEPRKP